MANSYWQNWDAKITNAAVSGQRQFMTIAFTKLSLKNQNSVFLDLLSDLFNKTVTGHSNNGVKIKMARVKKQMSRTILLVEDEAPIREMLSFVLEQAGFGVVEAEDFDVALEKVKEPYPDLILLDWMLPGGSGVQLAKKLKQHEFTREIPVIMLTARGEEDDKIRGLEAGADDYVTKPFSPKELVARIKAVMRRVTPTSKEEPIEFNGLVLEPVSHRVTANGDPVDMGPTEFKLLHFFMTHAERVYSRELLLDNVWGTNVYVEDRTVDVHIRRLRKALSTHGHDAMIQTVRGAGYRFSSKV